MSATIFHAADCGCGSCAAHRAESNRLRDGTPINSAPVQNSAERQIRDKVRMVATHEASMGVLSTGERIAAALVLDRYDLVKEYYGTMLEAADRLGNDWLKAALRVQRNGWEHSS